MISRLRTSIAVAVALVMTVVTLGRVELNWSGRPGGQDGAEDPGRPVASRSSVR